MVKQELRSKKQEFGELKHKKAQNERKVIPNDDEQENIRRYLDDTQLQINSYALYGKHLGKLLQNILEGFTIKSSCQQMYNKESSTFRLIGD